MPESITRELTITVTEEFARQLESLAQKESRDISELFREAFRVYFARQRRQEMIDSRELASQHAELNPANYVPDDTRRLLEESREEMKALRTFAHEVFENPTKADEWLKEPNIALKHRSPLDASGEPSGRDQVNALLTKIQYGVLA